MNKKIKNWLVSILAIGISFNLVWYAIIFISKENAKNIYGRIKNNERVYVYETYSKVLENVLFIKDLNDSNAIIHYYDAQEKGKDSVLGVSEINVMPLAVVVPLYVFRNVEHSKMIEIIDVDTSCWGYIKGYVDKRTIHKNPPPDSLIVKNRAFYEKQKLNQTTHFNQNSPYGFYCKCYD